MSDLAHVRAVALELIALHLPTGWTFDLDHARRRAGACHFTDRRITLSRHLAARYDDETNRQTLLHEIAHALAGPQAGHGQRWLRTARDLGYTGGVRHDGEVAVELATWVGTCPAGHVAHRFRRPTRQLSCARCSRRYDERNLISWEQRSPR